jgi:hypothetical protein
MISARSRSPSNHLALDEYDLALGVASLKDRRERRGA